jgi:diguanylate cyclase (GGDEF)-like protein
MLVGAIYQGLVQLIDRSDTHRPFSSPGLGLRLLPFGLATAIGIVAPLVTPGTDFDGTLRDMGSVAVCIVVSVVIVWLVNRGRLVSTRWDLLPVLGYVAALASLRAATNGLSLPYLPLLTLAMMWLALYHSRLQFVIGVSLITALTVYGLIRNDVVAWQWIDDLNRMAQAIAVGLVILFLLSRIRKQQEDLAYMAITDSLTGVANSRTWNATIRSEMARSLSQRETFTIGILCIDEIGEMNAGLGVDAGDAFLASAARAWVEKLRENDCLFRLHGAHFAVLLPSTESDLANALLEQIRCAVPASSCNVGAACWNRKEDPQEMVRRAYKALDVALESGGDCVVIDDVPIAEWRSDQADDRSLQSV